MLTLPPKFENDIKQSSVTIYPLIQIGEEIFISQVKEMFDGQVYEDHNLKVSNIKESIDFESRNFKISNVSITLSNYADLSDKLSSIDLMNLPVYIYWKTQSCKSLTDCLKVYEANIRRFDHDEKTIKIKLEDSTQEKIKKDVPIANLGTSQYVYSDKYINKYIPITYGEHDYAPAVLWKGDPHDNEFRVICDDVFNITGADRDIDTWISNSSKALRVFKGVYIDVFKKVIYNDTFINPGEYDEDNNYYVYPDSIKAKMYYDGGKPKNPFANDEFQGSFKRYPVGIELIDTDGESFDGTVATTWDWLDESGDTSGNDVYPPIEMSNPNSSFDKYQSVFNDDDESFDTYTSLPDIDEDGAEDVEGYDYEALYTQYESWKTNNLTEYNALSDLHTTVMGYASHPVATIDIPGQYNDTAHDVSGDIFDFEPIDVWGVRFKGVGGTDRLLYNYGWNKSNGERHATPYAPSDGHEEKIGYFNREGTAEDLGIDWVGHRHGDFSQGYANRFGGEGYMFPKDDVGNVHGDDGDPAEGPLAPLYPYIGLVASSVGAESNSGTKADPPTNINVTWHSSPSSFDHLNTTMEDEDGFQKSTMSRLHRLKYMHAVESTGNTNFAFIQLPSLFQIRARLEGFGYVPAQDNSAQGYVNSTFFTDSQGSPGLANQCRYSDPYMGRSIRPYTDYSALGNGGQYNYTSEEFDVGGDLSNIYADENYITYCKGMGNPFDFSNPPFTYHWNEENYRSDFNGYNMNLTAGTDHWQSSNAFRYNTFQPRISRMKPYGNVVWILGIKSDDDLSKYGIGWDSGNSGYDIDRYVTVTFCPTNMQYADTLGHVGSESDSTSSYTPWATSVQGTTLNDGNAYNLPEGLVSGAVAHYSLTELFDMKQFPLYIPYEQMDDGINRSVEGGTEGRYGWDGSRIVNPRYKCYWNGIPENDGIYGEDYSSAGCSQFVNASNLWTSGEDRWYALSLKTISNYTKAGFIQSCYGESISLEEYDSFENDEEAQKEAVSELSHIRIGGGTIQGANPEGYVPLRADQGDSNDKGQFLGLKVKLPEIELEDNIDLAHHAFWKRKIEFKRDSFGSDASDNVNHLFVFAAAVEKDREVRAEQNESSTPIETNDGEVLDVLKSCTTVFRESLETLQEVGLDYNDNPNSFILDNISNPNPRKIFYNNDTYVDSLESEEDVSLFTDNGGSVINDDTIPYVGGGFGYEKGYTMWGNPDDFDSFNILFLGDRSADGDAAFNMNFQLKLYETYIEHVCDFENLTGSDFYIKARGRGNWYQHGGGWWSSGHYHYTPTEQPAHVIKNLLNQELNIPSGNILDDSFQQAMDYDSSWKLAFSVTDKIDCKKLIEQICSNTRYFLKIDYNHNAKIIRISPHYGSTSVNENTIIDNQKVLNYKFTRTKLDDVKSKVMVKFDYDYAVGEFRRNTGWFSAKDYFGDGDLEEDPYVYTEDQPWQLSHRIGNIGYRAGYFNLDKKEKDSELVFEAHYIRDRKTAYYLQQFLATWYCNQHTIISLDLDISYVGLEVGDIIAFSEAINNVKAYGEDYSLKSGSRYSRNGQDIFTKFMIQEVSKKSNKVSVKCIQMHNGNNQAYFPGYGGTTGTKGNIRRTNVEPNEVDVQLIEDYLDGDNSFTREQIKSMDVNNSASITQSDITYLESKID